MSREIHSYDYVNHPYEAVRDTLKRDALATFHAATKSASARAEDVASALRVDVAGIQIVKDIAIKVNTIQERPDQAMGTEVTNIALEWEAASQPRIFPLMRAELRVYRLSRSETQLEFIGQYDPPLGALGKAINAIVGHRIAEASVHRFLSDVAAHLRKEIGSVA